MKSKAELADNEVLASIKREGNYTKAAFFLGVVQMTAKTVFSEPTLIDLIRQRTNHEN